MPGAASSAAAASRQIDTGWTLPTGLPAPIFRFDASLRPEPTGTAVDPNELVSYNPYGITIEHSEGTTDMLDSFGANNMPAMRFIQTGVGFFRLRQPPGEDFFSSGEMVWVGQLLTGGNDGPYFMRVEDAGVAHRFIVYPAFGGNKLWLNVNNGSGTHSWSSTAWKNVPLIVDAYYSASVGGTHVNVNGTQRLTTSVTPPGGDTMFSQGYDGTTWGAGKMYTAEMLIFTDVLSSGQRSSLYSALASRYGI